MPESLAPGMTHSIEAGEELVIVDVEGQEFSVVGKESQIVMSFLIAFDAWITVKRSGVQGVVIDVAWAQLQTAWDALPLRVLGQMPSVKTMTSISLG